MEIFIETAYPQTAFRGVAALQRWQKSMSRVEHVRQTFILFLSRHVGLQRLAERSAGDGLHTVDCALMSDGVRLLNIIALYNSLGRAPISAADYIRCCYVKLLGSRAMACDQVSVGLPIFGKTYDDEY